MSDYVSRLIARTLQIAPVVQPRLRFRFEPSDLPDAPTMPLLPAPVETGAERRPVPRPPAPRAIPAEDPGTPPAPRRRPGQYSARFAPSPEDEKVAVPSAPARRSTPMPDIGERRHEVRGGRPSPAHGPVQPTVNRAVADDRRGSAISARRPAARELAPDTSGATRQPIAQVTAAMRPETGAVPDAPPQAPWTRGAERPAPSTVKVHIGRIDVRAVVSPPEPPHRPARPKAAPMLTLKEYLERCRGGRP